MLYRYYYTCVAHRRENYYVALVRIFPLLCTRPHRNLHYSQFVYKAYVSSLLPLLEIRACFLSTLRLAQVEKKRKRKEKEKKRKTESIGESYVSRQDRTRTRSRAHAHHKLGLMRFYANTRANDNDLNSHERTKVEDILLTTHIYI